MTLLLSIAESAIYEGISYKGLQKRVQRKRLKPVKIPIQKFPGYECHVPLTELSEKDQVKYYQAKRNQQQEITKPPSLTPTERLKNKE